MSPATGEPAGPPPWTGPWADDARRLFDAWQAVVEQVDQMASAEPGAMPADHSPECRYCPLCQGIGVLRRAGPDLLDQVSDFAAGLAATLRAARPSPGGTAPGASAADDPDPAPGDPAPGPVEDGSAGTVRPPSTVRIDVTD